MRISTLITYILKTMKALLLLSSSSDFLCGFIRTSALWLPRHPGFPIISISLLNRLPSLDSLKRCLSPIEALTSSGRVRCARVVDDSPEIRVMRQDEALADPVRDELAEGVEVSSDVEQDHG